MLRRLMGDPGAGVEAASVMAAAKAARDVVIAARRLSEVTDERGSVNKQDRGAVLALRHALEYVDAEALETLRKLAVGEFEGGLE
jgi:hypothetical protein